MAPPIAMTTYYLSSVRVIAMRPESKNAFTFFSCFGSEDPHHPPLGEGCRCFSKGRRHKRGTSSLEKRLSKERIFQNPAGSTASHFTFAFCTNSQAGMRRTTAAKA